MVRASVICLISSLLCASADDATAQRRPLHDAGRAVTVFAEDAWDVVTAPTRWGSRQWATFGAVVAVGGALMAVDEDLGAIMVRNQDEPVLRTLDDVGDDFGKLGLMGETWPLYMGAMVAGYAVDAPPLMRFGAQVLEAQYLSGALRNAGKLVLGRRRPYEDKGPYYFSFDGGTSMPSGHAATVFSLAEVVRLRTHRWWISGPVYAVAVSIAYKRMSSEQHWPSDVWIGAVSGIAAARFVVHRHEPGPELEPEPGLGLVPLVVPGAGVGLALDRRF